MKVASGEVGGFIRRMTPEGSGAMDVGGSADYWGMPTGWVNGWILRGSNLTDVPHHRRSLHVRQAPYRVSRNTVTRSDCRSGFIPDRFLPGLTQQEFAALAGFDYKFYQYVESPRKKQFWLETADRIAAAYGMELWQLLHPNYRRYSCLRAKGHTQSGFSATNSGQ